MFRSISMRRKAQGDRGGEFVVRLVSATLVARGETTTFNVFAKIKEDTSRPVKSSVKKGTSAPVWDESFPMGVPDIINMVLTIALFHRSGATKSELLGTASVRIKDIDMTAAREQTVQLPLSAEAGSVVVGITLSDATRAKLTEMGELIGSSPRGPARAADAPRPAGVVALPSSPSKPSAPEEAHPAVADKKPAAVPALSMQQVAPSPSPAIKSPTGLGGMAGLASRLNPVKLLDGSSKSPIKSPRGGAHHSGGNVTLQVLGAQWPTTVRALFVRIEPDGGAAATLETPDEPSPASWPSTTFSFPVANVADWHCRVVVCARIDDYKGKHEEGQSLPSKELGELTLLGDESAIETRWFDTNVAGGRVQLNYSVRTTTAAEALVQARQGLQTGPGTVLLMVFEAERLSAKDAGSTSDPFIQVETINGVAPRKRMRTKVVPKTVLPQWNEQFKIDVADVAAWTVVLTVFDHDFGKDEFMGRVTVVGSNAVVQKTWIDVIDGQGRVKVGHSVVSAATARAEKAAHSEQLGASNLLRRMVSPRAPASTASSGYVRMFVFSADGLMAKDATGSSDPYVTVADLRDKDGKKMRTSTQKQTLDPVWNETFVFPVPDMNKWAVRLQLWDEDLLGKAALGHVDVVAGSAKVARQTFPVLEGVGQLNLGWVVARDPPVVESDESAAALPSRAMPVDREGALRIHLRSVSKATRPTAQPDGPFGIVVRYVEAVGERNQSVVAEGDAFHEWKNEWLEVPVDDLAAWQLTLEVHAASNDALLGSVSLQADKFDLGGSVDYKTLPLAGGGEVELGVTPSKQSKRLAATIQRAKAALEAEEIKRARLHAQTVMQQLGKEGVNAGDFELRIEEASLDAQTGSVYAVVSGVLLADRSTFKTKAVKKAGSVFRWDDERTLHVPDLANFSFDIELWESVTFGKDLFISAVNIDALMLVSLTEQAQLPLIVPTGDEKGTIKLVIKASSPAQEVLKRLVSEAAPEAAAVATVWPEDRMGVLRVHVVRGSSLVAMDIGGTSDPYVVAKSHFDTAGKRVCTPTLKKTLNPIWNKWFDIPMRDVAALDMTLEIWDYDVAADDQMGYVMLRASEWDYSDVEQRKTLQVINGQGTLEIGIAPTLSSRSLFRKLRAAKAAGLAPPSFTGLAERIIKSKNGGVISIHIGTGRGLRAADRGGTSDPYCMIPKSYFVGTDGRAIKTSVQYKTLEPKWDQHFEAFIPDLTCIQFKISIFDYDLFGPDPLGYVSVKDFRHFLETGEEYQELPVKDGTGFITVGLKATESAMRVLERMWREQAEEKERAEALRDAEEHRQRILVECRKRLELMKSTTPLYKPRTYDPIMQLVLTLLVAALLVHSFGPFVWDLVMDD